MTGDALAADDARQRRANQADADEGYSVEKRFGHFYALRNSASAETTPRLASSVPMLMRSAFGKP